MGKPLNSMPVRKGELGNGGTSVRDFWHLYGP